MKEIYKIINGYNGMYEVSNFGNIRSHKYTKPRLLKQRAHRNKYLYVNLCKNGKYKSINVHRLVAEYFLGTSNLTVNHKDKNRQNNRIDNLEWLSMEDNWKHSRS